MVEESDEGARPQTVSCAKSKSKAEVVWASRTATWSQRPGNAEEDDRESRGKSRLETKPDASKSECSSVPEAEARLCSGTNIGRGKEICDGADGGSDVEADRDDGSSAEENECA